MSDNQDIATALAALYPSQAKAFFSAACPAQAELMAGETEITTGMVEKRLNEFTHGRHCARSAMTMLGIDALAIPKGPSREPLWPPGIIGSISHTDSAAAAVVARQADMVAIGLDIEGALPLKADLMQMICLREENPDQDGMRAKLLFSIKESIYKCLFPLVNEYIDFLEMEVSLDDALMTFSAKPRAARLDSKLIARIHGRYRHDSQFIISAAWIPRP